MKVGDVTYKSHRPKFIGKVIEVIPQTAPPWPKYRIKWEDGSVNVQDGYVVRSLDDLIAEHEKALKTHRANQLRGKAL